MNDSKKRPKQLTARLTEEQWAAIDELLKKDEWDITVMVKKALKLLCERHKVKWPGTNE